VRRVRAIAALRLKLAVRRLQGPGGAAQLAAAILTTGLGVVFALGAGVGLGIMVHLFASSGDPDKLRTAFLIVFWVAFFFGIFLPLLRGTMNQGFDVSPFVVFPLSRPRLYAINLAATFGGTDHLLYYPTLLATAVAGVLAPGVPAAAGLALIGLCLFFYVAWGHALALLLVSVMRARRIREIVGIVVLLLLIAASFVPAMLDGSRPELTESLPEAKAALRVAARLGQVLPPTIAAEGLTSLHAPRGGPRAALSLLWLLLWDVAGVLIGYVIFDRHHLREPGVRVTPRLGRRLPVARAGGGWLSFDGRPLAALPAGVRGVAAKDLHYMLRSVLGRFNLFMMPVFVIVIVFLLGRRVDEPVFGIDPQAVLLFGLLLYAVMFSNNFVNNAFAWEGDGVQSYFLCPVSSRAVLVGKNLAVWLYNVVLFGLVIIIFSALTGFPGIATVISATLMFASAVLLFTSCGNVISVMLPVPRDMSSLQNQPSQMAMLLSFLVLATIALLIGPLLSLPLLFGWPGLQPVLLAAFFAATIVVYTLTLRQASRLFENRREQIAETLKSVR
jgi:hypothetical protein